MRLYGRDYARAELLRRIGDISQVAGIKSYTLNDGRAQGIEAFDVKTGSGLTYTVLKDRALDIAWMDYRGYAIGFMDKGGISHPKYYQPQGAEWLRAFNGGVLTTCGLTNVGPAQEGDMADKGLHGRISNTPSYEVSYIQKWDGDDLILKIEGKAKESVLFGENLTLHRTIMTKAGENKLKLVDEITNDSFVKSPIMILYHMNIGFPVVSENSAFIGPILWTKPRDVEAEKGLENAKTFEQPTPGYKEQVFFHRVAADDDGNTCVGLINEDINIGFYISYNTRELPHLTQWKMMGEQDYVVGIEPGNCHPIGHEEAKRRCELEVLAPGETKRIEIELGVLTTWEEIQHFKDCTRKLKEKNY